MVSITHATQVVVADDSNYPVGSDEWNDDHINKLATSNLVFYVRTDGSDSNTGLANTAGGAFLTIQHAVDVVCSYDYEGLYYPTINVADGTYDEGVGIRITQPLNCGGDEPTLVGNTTTQANVIIQATGATFSIDGGGDEWRLKGVKLQSTGAGNIEVLRGSLLYFDKITFATSGNAYALRVNDGASVRVDSGGGGIRIEHTSSRGFVQAQHSAVAVLSFMSLTIANAWTINDNLNHGAFLYARQNSHVYFESSTITGGGNVTGRKYYFAESSTFEGVNEFGSTPVTLDGLPGTADGYRDWSVHERVALGSSDLSQNNVRILDAITGSNPSLDAHGPDTNISLTLTPKGSGGVISTGPIKTVSTTFGALPTAATAGSGARAFVTDCNTATFLATAAAGGSNKVPVVSDGTNWLVG
jgi:hypothetical protein